MERFSLIANYHNSGPQAVQLLEGPAHGHPPWDFINVPAGSALVQWFHEPRRWNFFGFRRIMSNALIAVIDLNEKRPDAELWLGLHEPDGRQFALHFVEGAKLDEVAQLNPDAPGGIWFRTVPDIPYAQRVEWLTELNEPLAGSELLRSGKLFHLGFELGRDLSGFLDATGHEGYFGYSEYPTDTAEANGIYERDRRWIGTFKPGWESYINDQRAKRLAECNT